MTRFRNGQVLVLGLPGDDNFNARVARDLDLEV
jgi:hypothetical protein